MSPISPPATLEPELKRTLAAADPNLTVTSVRTLQQQVDRSFDQQRAVASLAGLFGVVALVLAAIGLYGVTAYTVAQRTNEIGIRMALGADRGNVLGMVLRGAFRRVVFGLVLGLPLAVGAGYLLSAQLYGVKFWDPLALAIGAVSLAFVCLRRCHHPGATGRLDLADSCAANRLIRSARADSASGAGLALSDGDCNGGRLDAHFGRRVDLEPEQRADEQQRRHRHERRVVAAESLDDVAVGDGREQSRRPAPTCSSARPSTRRAVRPMSRQTPNTPDCWKVIAP